jgi:putative CocE/NonD family hydrolase
MTGGASSLAAQDFATRQAAATAYIAAHADREEQVMMPMRDGVRLNALILFLKDRPRRDLPTILVRHPYLTGGMVQGFAQYVRSGLENGYAFVFQSERGRYFSEGTYTYLAGSGKDGYDTVDWITRQPWSNGKVGTLGCSSSAEEQHKLNGMQHPGLAAAVPVGSGAGIGKVGPYNEMGNFYRGGAIQNLWFDWYYSAGYTHRPLFPPDLSREVMIRLARAWNIEPQMKPAGLESAIWTLPVNQIMERMQAAPSDLDRFVSWLPNDPRWKEVDFGGEGDRAGAPILMVNSWYDVSIGPNVAMYEYQAKNAANETARSNMFMIIAPTLHCEQGAVETEHTIVGDRDMGDARFDYVGAIQEFFDHFLKGVDNGVTRGPKVRAYMMGANQWRTYDSWPPAEARDVAYYLDSDGDAESVLGNGRLSTRAPVRAGSDKLTYDPLHPVPSVGGGVCCFAVLKGGSFDQVGVEMRRDVLVYSSPPLPETLEVAGPVKVSLYLSSDVKDTDLTAKLLDVYPDGRAFNLDDSIQRVRWREGWDKPVFMEPGRVYKVEVGPLVTSNAFLPGHRIRLEVSSSNFPHFERNLNTGGNNYDEAKPIVAHNVIHHSRAHASAITLPVLRKPVGASAG